MITPEQALANYHAGPEAVVKVICELSREVDLRQKRVEALERKVAQLSKNSSNSSKPPSSDIVKPKAKKRQKGKRKIGAQPGHPRHERPLFPEKEIDKFHDYRLTACPECGNSDVTFLDEPPRVIQQMELERFVVTKEEHRTYPVWCERCGKVHYHPFPEDVLKEGLFKERLTTLVAYMKAVDHASFSTIRKFIRDVLGEKVSRGYLRKVVEKASHKYMKDFNITVQFCIAHLIRDIKYLTSLPDPETRAYGKKLLGTVKDMFKVIHDRENLDPETFGRALEQSVNCRYEIATLDSRTRSMSADNIWTEFAKSYDEVIPRLHCYQRMVDKILRDSSQGTRIIDAGCGTGIVSQRLVAAGHPVYGFDNNPGMLEPAHARRESMPAGDRKNWQIETGDVLSFPDSAPRDADTLILNNVLFYVSEPRLVLDESIRHLRPGAVLIATGPRHRPDPRHIFKCAFDEWQQDGQDMAQLSSAVEHFMQCTQQLTSGTDEMVTFFEPQDLVSLLQEVGFRDVLEASGEDYYGENFYVAMRLPE